MNYLFFIFSNFFFYLAIYFLGCIIVSQWFFYLNLIFYFFSFKKVKKYYYIYFLTELKNFDLELEVKNIRIFDFIIFIVYFYFFAPMYALGWLLFYSLRFITSNNIIDVDELFTFFLNFDFNFFIAFYICNLMLMDYFFFYSKSYFFIFNYVDFPLLDYFLLVR